MRAHVYSASTNPLKMISDFYCYRNHRTHATLLQDISLNLEAGQRIGILGCNGAGKSTLLRLIGKIYSPTSGIIKYNAEPLGFFSIQYGINPEAIGLENIYLRGVELGYTLAEIREKAQDIIAFSGLGDHINKPVHSYSAGMMLRLAAAITLTVEPEVLLLDEWIGMGDRDFSIKIQKRLHEIVENASGLMLASHNRGLLRRVCGEGIVLSEGRIVYSGPINDAIECFDEGVESLK